jgi:hypothetical protein
MWEEWKERENNERIVRRSKEIWDGRKRKHHLVIMTCECGQQK